MQTLILPETDSLSMSAQMAEQTSLIQSRGTRPRPTRTNVSTKTMAREFLIAPDEMIESETREVSTSVPNVIGFQIATRNILNGFDRSDGRPILRM